MIEKIAQMIDPVWVVAALLVVGFWLDMRRMIDHEAKYRQSRRSALLILLGVPQRSCNTSSTGHHSIRLRSGAGGGSGGCGTTTITYIVGGGIGGGSYSHGTEGGAR